jgi:AcrR family transcriptional regulator
VFDEHGPEVPLDELARTAGVANATLYRHFATRAELILAVYAEEVVGLGELAEQLLDAGDPEHALTDWLRAFVRHVADKRDLALATGIAMTGLPDDRLERLFAPARYGYPTATAGVLRQAHHAGVEHLLVAELCGGTGS